MTLGDAPGGGGTRSEVRSKKKGCHNDDLTVFRGGRLCDNLFFLLRPFPSTRPAPSLTPRPACDAPRRGDLLVTQVVFHLKMYLVHLWLDHTVPYCTTPYHDVT